MPVEGAVIGIMRDKSFAADPIVTEVRTGGDGSFTATVKAKDVDSYYAKLFLNDKEGVYLRDWWTLSVREYNSANRGKNKTNLVDLGVTEVSRDGGKGAPQCAVWQGGRAAWQEYMRATGQRPLIGEHGNYQIVMESTDSGIVWTSRDTTHWEIGYSPGEYANVLAPDNPEQLSYSDLFELYGTSVHEFGHALRHTADGTDNHFNWDATRFLYAHTHEHCQSYPKGYAWNDGYGFNEGWSDYWQGTDLSLLQGCVTGGMDPKNFQQEGAVALDLDTLEGSLGTCAGIPTNVRGDDLKRQRRGLMFGVLAGAGHEKVHSDADFRAAFVRRFPACTIPAPGTLSAAVPPPGGAVHPPVVEPGQVIARLSAVRGRLTSLPAEIAEADRGAQLEAATQDLEQRALLTTRPAYLRGQLAYATLLEQHLAKEQANPPTVAYLMTAAGEQERAAEVTAFDNQARAITLKTLTDERSALMAKDPAAHADDISLLDHEISEVQSGSDRASAVMLQAVADSGDTVQAATHN